MALACGAGGFWQSSGVSAVAIIVVLLGIFARFWKSPNPARRIVCKLRALSLERRNPERKPKSPRARKTSTAKKPAASLEDPFPIAACSAVFFT